MRVHTGKWKLQENQIFNHIPLKYRAILVSLQGERPYQCPHCVKRFAQGNDLKAHVRRHTGERYKCDVCGAGFIQGYHLTSHKRTVHGIDMKSHIRRVTKIPPSNQQVPIDHHSEIVPSITKPKIYQVLASDDHQLFNPHEALDVQHQLLAPMTLDDGQHIVIDPQQTIVMLHMNNDIDIKMEPSLNQLSHNSQTVVRAGGAFKGISFLFWLLYSRNCFRQRRIANNFNKCINNLWIVYTRQRVSNAIDDQNNQCIIMVERIS